MLMMLCSAWVAAMQQTPQFDAQQRMQDTAARDVSQKSQLSKFLRHTQQTLQHLDSAHQGQHAAMSRHVSMQSTATVDQQVDCSHPTQQTHSAHSMLNDQHCHHAQQDHADLQQSMMGKGHTPCSDCYSAHCQTLSNVQSINSLMVRPLALQPAPTQQYAVLQLQHLSGFWQQILRPPRA